MLCEAAIVQTVPVHSQILLCGAYLKPIQTSLMTRKVLHLNASRVMEQA